MNAGNEGTEIGATSQGKRNMRSEVCAYRRNHPVNVAPTFTDAYSAEQNTAQESLSHAEPFHARGCIAGEYPERYRLLIDKRHLHQLDVDRQAEPPVELIKQCGFPAGEHFAERRNVFRSQLHD